MEATFGVAASVDCTLRGGANMFVRKCLELAFFCLSTGVMLMGQAIQTHPANPHYYLFRGKPTILITSAEHYGAVINLAFDYVPYLDALKAHGLNYTRIYPGAMFETTDKFITGNPLGPKPRDLIVPWARSDQPGYMTGGNKFDLDRWNPAYFARLKDFISKASERGIVVEICFFNSQYTDTWLISPLYYENNVQGIGKCEYRDAQALGCGDLTEREAAYVSKLTREVNSFDNVILEICDECASIVTGAKLTGPWVSRMMDAAYDAERSLPQKHLIAQEVEGLFGGAMDFSMDPRLSIVTAQYLWGDHPSEHGGEMGGFHGLDYKYDLNKPIELNETNWFPFGYSEERIAESRVESWEFLVGGGSGFNQLNGLFTPANPSGASPENDQLLGALKNLKDFVETFDFLKMRPDHLFVIGGLSDPNVHFRAISEVGKQYALYIHHSTQARGAYIVHPGAYHEDILATLPKGNYKADWLDPASGELLASAKIRHTGGELTLSTPGTYKVDIALRIKLQSNQ